MGFWRPKARFPTVAISAANGSKVRTNMVVLNRHEQHEKPGGSLRCAHSRLRCWGLNSLASLSKVLVNSLANGEALTGSLLLGHLDGGFISLGDTALLLSDVELNVAVGAEVGGDTTVGTVGTAATLDGTLHNNVSNSALIGVETLGLGVGLSVDEQFLDGLNGLLGPAATDGLEFLALSVSLSIVSTEGNNLLVLETVIHIVDCFLNQPTLDRLSDIVGVLVVSAEVSNLAGSG